MLLTGLAHGLGRLDVVTETLQKVLALDPTDLRSRINYAGALVKLGKPREAAEQFHVLRERDPEDLWHALNESASLAHAGQLEAALAVYEESCRAPSPKLEAMLGRAETLRLLDRPIEAFRSLDEIRNTWWSEPRFVRLYMSIAFAAGMDRQGSLAVGQLAELQRAGGTNCEFLRAISRDDLERSLVDRQSHDATVSEYHLRGQVPWIMIEEGRRRVPYLGWFVRTQPLAWCPDAPQGRAEFSVYATNGFCVVDDGTGGKAMVRIECPNAGTQVAIDLSSLFTLHALGLLDVTAGYFGKVMVPAVYLDRVLEERSRLLPNQLSQKTALEQVRAGIDAGRIDVRPRGASGEGERPVLVDEYAEPPPGGATSYRVLEVIEALHTRGRVTGADLDRVKQAFSRQRRSGARALTLFSRLEFDLFTLLTLAQIGCLEPVLQGFRVSVSREAETAVARGLREFLFRDEVRSAHADLWSRVRADPRFVITAVIPPRALSQGDSEQLSAAVLSLGASWVAAQQGIPLLVDDRMIQVVTQNELARHEAVAFSTDRLIERLREVGAIENNRAIDATLQLMRWRYRFVLPSTEVLKGLLERFREHPPGLGLQEVAEYVHDCMRDPGLFSGFEPTMPPTSMASRLHHGWIEVVVQFVMNVWADETWPEAPARQVTNWATCQLLPSLPSTMAGPVQGAHARLEHRIIISMALIASSVVESPGRANAGLLAIAGALGIRERDLHETLADVIAERE
jgi:hypothetical protein